MIKRNAYASATIAFAKPVAIKRLIEYFRNKLYPNKIIKSDSLAHYRVQHFRVVGSAISIPNEYFVERNSAWKTCTRVCERDIYTCKFHAI